MDDSGLSTLAGKPVPADAVIDVGVLCDAYSNLMPDPSIPSQRVVFGTSGHRGISLECSFNAAHVAAITQAICNERAAHLIDGPLFLGIDTHALSVPARDTALEVLAANDVPVMLAVDEYTPTPAVSHAILTHNRGRTQGLADGIVITPSHNPPEYGGFKYNPPNGGPAGEEVTSRIEAAANAYLENRLVGVRRHSLTAARAGKRMHRHDYLGAYVADLDRVIDMAAIRDARVHMAVDPLGGAGVHYWPRIAEDYGLDLTVANDIVDPTFGFMTLDWDGRIRMDPSSPDAMQRLLALKTDYDIAFACDTDHDRHGVVTPAGLMPANHYLCVMIDYLFGHRPQWRADAEVAKTAVSTALIDRLAHRLGRRVYETPTGFKWFADGLLRGDLAFAGEESAGATFARRDGTVWTTDKDGITAALLAAEITARTGLDPARCYERLAVELGRPWGQRIDAPASAEQKQHLARMSPRQVTSRTLAGEPIERVLGCAPGNDAPLGGIKVVTATGWFSARPSGTEDIYKIYAESFRDADHLQRILTEAQTLVAVALESPE